MTRVGDGFSSGRGRVFVAAFVASLVVVASALAATGDLTNQGCIDDNDSGPETCAQSTDGLDLISDVAVSPDGKSVYVTSLGDDAITRFFRNTTTGALVPKGCIDDNDIVGEPCTQTVDGLDNPIAIAVSSNGKSVYVAGEGDHAIVRFHRNLTSGALTPAGCIDDNDTGPEPCAQSTNALHDIRDVTVSPDGLSVYAVAGVTSNAIVRFDRNPTTGGLTPRNCIEDDTTATTDDCTLQTTGLNIAQSVVVSPDNKSVYVTSAADDAIVRFARDTSNGVLLRRDCIEDDDSGDGDCAQQVAGLTGASALAMSDDSKSLYATGSSDSAVARFTRNLTSGALTYNGCIDDNDTVADSCVNTIDGLGIAQDLAVSADGKSVYVAASGDNALTTLDRNTTNGALTASGCIQDGDGVNPTAECAQTAPGLLVTVAVAVSPDDLSVYTGSIEHTVARFARAP